MSLRSLAQSRSDPRSKSTGEGLVSVKPTFVPQALEAELM